MAKHTHQLERLLLRGDKGNRIKFRNKPIGVIGNAKRGKKTIFIWWQSEWHKYSTETHMAFAMSVPVIKHLEKRDTDQIYLAEYHKFFDFEDIRDGELVREEDIPYDQKMVFIPK